MTFFIDFTLLTLFVEVNTKALICNTYLIGENVITGESVGDRRSFLQKYGELPRLIPSDQSCSVQLNQCLKQKLLLEESVEKFNQLRDTTESLIDNLTKNRDLKSTIANYKNIQKEIDNLIETLSSQNNHDPDYSTQIDSVGDIDYFGDTEISDYSSDTPILNRFPLKDIKSNQRNTHSKNHQTPEKSQTPPPKRHFHQKLVSQRNTDNSTNKRSNNPSQPNVKISPKFAHTTNQQSINRVTHEKSQQHNQIKFRPTVDITPSKNTSTVSVKNKNITSVDDQHTNTFADHAPTTSVIGTNTSPKIPDNSSDESISSDENIKHFISDEAKLKEQITKELTVSLAKDLKEHLANELSKYFARECTASDNSYPCFKLVHSKNASQEASI